MIRRALVGISLIGLLGCGGRAAKPPPLEEDRGARPLDAGVEDDDYSDLGFDGGIAGRDARPDLVHDEADGGVRCPTSWFPVNPGNSWLYRVLSPPSAGHPPYMKASSMVRFEPVPVEGPHKGKVALRVESRARKDREDQTVSWQLGDGGRVVRLAELSYKLSTGLLNLTEYWTPHKLRLDESAMRLVPGARWEEPYEEVKRPVGGDPTVGARSDRWAVDAIGEIVSVPAGTFRTVRLRKFTGLLRDEEDGKAYWFACGVGKVLERSRRGKEEQLVDYRIVR